MEHVHSPLRLVFVGHLHRPTAPWASIATRHLAAKRAPWSNVRRLCRGAVHRLSWRCTPPTALLYAVNEVNELDGQAGGGVYGLRLPPIHRPSVRVITQSSLGTGPCHVAVESGGRYVCWPPTIWAAVSACLPHYAGGRPGARQRPGPARGLRTRTPLAPVEPHAHSVTLTHRRRNVSLVADLWARQDHGHYTPRRGGRPVYTRQCPSPP
jgi:hypothetical protein